MPALGTTPRRGIRWRSAVGTVVVVMVLFIIFVFSVRWFRARPAKNDAVAPSIADVLTPDPISRSVIQNAIDTHSRLATLYRQGTDEIVGEATRGEKDGGYYVELKANVPEIDREKT